MRKIRGARGQVRCDDNIVVYAIYEERERYAILIRDKNYRGYDKRRYVRHMLRYAMA